MSYFWGALGWLWGKKLFFALTLAATLLFTVILFPFGDLSDVVTAAVSRGTRGAVYVQFDSLDLNLVPQPAISATELVVETTLPALRAKYAKVTPSLVNILLSLPTVLRAAGGNQEAAASLGTKLGVAITARDILGGNVDLALGPGSHGEQGGDRSRVTLAVEKLNLGDVQKWADLGVVFNGRAHVQTDVQFTPDFKEQPEGEFLVRLEKFVLPASVVQVDMNGTPLPVNLPEVTLANVRLKGKLARGNLTIEDGTFGQKPDPVFGRLKGTMGMSLMPGPGGAVAPVFGSYNLTVELTTTQMIERELSFAFVMLGPGRSPNPGGGAHYLFRAMGQGIGMEYAPNITRVGTF